MDGDTLALLEKARALNSKLFSLPRLQLVSILAYYAPDGVEFRELKAALKMTDGKLLSNIYALEKMGYLKAAKVNVENKTLTAYRLTEEGKLEYARIRAWLREWLKEGTK